MIIAHRGGFPENTLTAFRKSVINGADGIEFDVHITKDDVIIVTHDHYINDINISDLTYESILSFNESIPTLQDTIDCICETYVSTQSYDTPIFPIINVEIKSWNTSIKIGNFIKNYIYINPDKIKLNNFLFTSFLHTELLCIHYSLPDAKLGFLYACWPVNIFHELKENNIDLVVISEYMATKQNIDLLHTKGITCWVYTVNNVNRIKELTKFGIDAIITDDVLFHQIKL